LLAMSNEENVKRMGELLRSGATMLEYNCPVCGSPLFRIKGEVWCPNCNKRVIISREGEETQVPINQVTMQPLLSETEKIILLKIQEICQQIADEKDIGKLERLSGLLAKWLDALERMRRIQKL